MNWNKIKEYLNIEKIREYLLTELKVSYLRGPYDIYENEGEDKRQKDINSQLEKMFDDII